MGRSPYTKTMEAKLLEMINTKNLQDLKIIDLVIEERYHRLVQRIDYKIHQLANELRIEFKNLNCECGTPRRPAFDDKHQKPIEDGRTLQDSSHESLNSGKEFLYDVPIDTNSFEDDDAVFKSVKTPVKKKPRVRLLYISPKSSHSRSTSVFTKCQREDDSVSGSVSGSVSSNNSNLSLSKFHLNNKNFEIFDNFLKTKKNKKQIDLTGFMNRLKNNDKVSCVNPYVYNYSKYGLKSPVCESLVKYTYDIEFLLQFKSVVKKIEVDDEWKSKISEIF